MSGNAQPTDEILAIKEFLIETLKQWPELQTAQAASGRRICCLSLNQTWMGEDGNSIYIRPFVVDLINETIQPVTNLNPPSRSEMFEERLNRAQRVLIDRNISVATESNTDSRIPYLVIDLAQEGLLVRLERVWKHDFKKDPEDCYLDIAVRKMKSGVLQPVLDDVLTKTVASLLGPGITRRLAADKKRKLILSVLQAAASAISRHAAFHDIDRDRLRACIEEGIPEIFPKPERDTTSVSSFPSPEGKSRFG